MKLLGSAFPEEYNSAEGIQWLSDTQAACTWITVLILYLASLMTHVWPDCTVAYRTPVTAFDVIEKKSALWGTTHAEHANLWEWWQRSIASERTKHCFIFLHSEIKRGFPELFLIHVLNALVALQTYDSPPLHLTSADTCRDIHKHANLPL